MRYAVSLTTPTSSNFGSSVMRRPLARGAWMQFGIDQRVEFQIAIERLAPAKCSIPRDSVLRQSFSTVPTHWDGAAEPREHLQDRLHVGIDIGMA